MNNINNDIDRFDGKYLKCIVSKYPSVLNFLANSGSMIILQPQKDEPITDIVESYDITKGKYTITAKNANNDLKRNYIYLGNEFLASGYGFSTIQYRNSGERIIKTYDSTIERLDNADKKESLERTNEDTKLWKNFESYVAINGGPIENTIVNFNNDPTKRIKTKDIILYGEEATYEDLKIDDVSITLYDTYGKSYKVENNECVFPFGNIVSNIIVEITGKDNDSGGLNYLEVLHDFHSKDSNYDSYEGIIIKYDTDTDNIIYDNIDSKYNLHKWYYHKQLSSVKFVIDEQKDNVIKDIYLYVKKTPEINYKFYPGLLNHTYIDSNETIKLISSGNAIKDHKLTLGTRMSIVPQYYIQYNFSSLVLLENFNNSMIAPLNAINKDVITEITIELEQTAEYKYFQVAIPSNFALHKVYLVKNNNEKFNITGAVNKIKSDISMPYVSSPYNDNKYYCIKHNIYILTSELAIKRNVSICLEVVNVNKNDLTIEMLEKSELQNMFMGSNDAININDEEFNNLYWLNGKKYNNGELADKLIQMQENGINKIN